MKSQTPLPVLRLGRTSGRDQIGSQAGQLRSRVAARLWLPLRRGQLNLCDRDGFDWFNALLTNELDVHSLFLRLSQQDEPERRLTLHRLAIPYDVATLHMCFGFSANC